MRMFEYIIYSTKTANAQDGSETNDPQGGSKIQAAAEQRFGMVTVEERYILY